MDDRRQARDYRLAVIVLLYTFLGSNLVRAQQTPQPTLDEILLRLENNLHHYDSQVPNFFCDEHVASLMVYGKKRQSSVTDSVFRLKRVLNLDQATTFIESREIKTVNGIPAVGTHISGPSILTGVFSGGLDTVSLSQKACMRYTLLPIRPGEPYIVQFATLPGNHRPPDCVLREDGSGQVFIDPATMQVKRMEAIVPHHIILPTQTVDVWRITIDYSPILLGGQTFWMPTKITSRATPTADDDLAIWSFDASYTNYHKLEVTSHILPFSNSTAPR